MSAIECRILSISSHQIAGTMRMELPILQTVHPEEFYHRNSSIFGGLVQYGCSWIHSTGPRGKPQTIWSDHGTNFVGASRELRELVEFLNHQVAEKVISEFCSIQWDFRPEHAFILEAPGRQQLRALRST